VTVHKDILRDADVELSLEAMLRIAKRVAER